MNAIIKFQFIKDYIKSVLTEEKLHTCLFKYIKSFINLPVYQSTNLLVYLSTVITPFFILRISFQGRRGTIVAQMSNVSKHMVLTTVEGNTHPKINL